MTPAMAPLARCLACRARLGEAAVCTRCGTDFSIARRAQRQANALACVAVQALARGETRQAAAAAQAASALANPLLAQAVARVIRRREGKPGFSAPAAPAAPSRKAPPF